MRYVILPLLLLLVVGCQQTRQQVVPGTSGTIAFDFRPYLEDDFLFTPQDYDGEYEPVGMITLSVFPRAENLNAPAGQKRITPQNGYVQNGYMVEHVETDTLVARAYRQAKAMGADAIMNFDVAPTTRTVQTGTASSITLTGFEVNGFAIDRK